MNSLFLIISVLVFLAVVLAGIFLVWYISRKVQRFSSILFGTSSITQGLKKQEEQLASTPKSVAGMTKVHMPQIMQDFPEFSLPEFIQKSENQLKGALHAVSTQNLDSLSMAADDLKEQIRMRIENNKQCKTREYFQNIRIHQTEVSDYQKLGGSCVIILQSAVEYHYTKEREGRPAEAPKRVQTKYNLHLMYVQDESLLDTHAAAKSTSCPQCGAPVNSLGHKSCEYCGSFVEPINIRSWSLTKIKEV